MSSDTYEPRDLAGMERAVLDAYEKIMHGSAMRRSSATGSPPDDNQPGQAYGSGVEWTYINVSPGSLGVPEEVIREHRGPNDKRPAWDISLKPAALDWLRENLGGSALPGFYNRDGYLVRVPRTGTELINEDKELVELDESVRVVLEVEEGPAQVRPVDTQMMISILHTELWPFVEKVDRQDKGGHEKILRTREQTMVPATLCSPAIAGSSEWEKVPKISAITHTPMLRRDGTFITAPGYDPASGVLYLPDRKLRLLPFLNEDGSLKESGVAWARDMLLYLLKDFPFESDTHKANMLAILLTPLMRRVILPPYPMFLISAHQRGTGKSLLANIAGRLHGSVHRPDISGDDEEIRKSITAVLTTTTAPVVNFDNVTNKIKSGNIANLLTSRTWTDRVLGKSSSIEATNDRLWLATGNNIAIGGDLARRVRWVKLDAAMDRPELRTDFSEMDILGWVDDNRGPLLTALLVLLGYWVQRGMPRAPIVRTDDYGAWTSAMMEILGGVGLEEGFARADTEDPTVSDDEAELEALLAEIYTLYGPGDWQIKTLRQYALENVGVSQMFEDAMPGIVLGAKDRWKSLGRYVLRHEKTFAGGKRFVRVREARGGVVWRVETSVSGTAL